MQPKPLYKQIKRIPFIFLGLILISASIKFVSDWKSIEETRLLEVSKHNLKEKTYQSVELGENSFTTGMEGTLYWEVNDLKEATLVGLADGDRLMSYYDILYFLFIDGVLFFMVYGMNDETVFSERLSAGLKIVVYCVMFYPFVMMIGDYFSSQAIQKLTNNQFKGQYRNFGIVKFQLIMYLMIFMYPFLKKAINLQKDQNLTI